MPIAKAGPFPLPGNGSGTITCSEKNLIKQRTTCSVAVRQRDGWGQRQYTISGPADRIAEADGMAKAFILQSQMQSHSQPAPKLGPAMPPQPGPPPGLWCQQQQQQQQQQQPWQQQQQPPQQFYPQPLQYPQQMPMYPQQQSMHVGGIAASLMQLQMQLAMNAMGGGVQQGGFGMLGQPSGMGGMGGMHGGMGSMGGMAGMGSMGSMMSMCRGPPGMGGMSGPGMDGMSGSGMGFGGMEVPQPATPTE
jgi:hypothetical protein